jgi:uncharacterized membrane protein YkvA (DUF1232 family)
VLAPITYRDILSLQTESGLSPEGLAAYFKVTNMTLRRWNKRDDLNEAVAAKYLPAIRDGLFKLHREGKLKSKKPAVQKLVQYATPAYFNDVLEQMKINTESYVGFSVGKASVAALAEIGTNYQNQPAEPAEIGGLQRLIKTLKEQGNQFKSEVLALVRFIDSKSGSKNAKMVAIGALVYLVMPMDLIPDSIPGIGLIDDFAFLTLALRYCKLKT